MNKELRVEFFGNENCNSGSLNNFIKLEDFMKRFGLKEEKGQSNEYGTEDIILSNDDLSVKVEARDGKVTHILEWEVVE